MTLRSVRRRWDPTDLETALKMVSRAERRALERAEELRVEAERLMRSASEQTAAVEPRVRAEHEAELAALRNELEATSRRTTVAEAELDLLRAGAADPGSDRRPTTAEPLRPLSGRTDPAGFAAATEAVASRIHALAQLELARAQEEAVRILAAAADQAEDLLATRVAALERDTAIAAAAREQAERDGERAATLRAEAEAVLDAARADAREVVEKARREAADVMLEVRRQIVEEVLSLREAMDRTRRSLESFVDATAAEAPADPEAAPRRAPSNGMRAPGEPQPQPAAPASAAAPDRAAPRPPG